MVTLALPELAIIIEDDVVLPTSTEPKLTLAGEVCN
jgi:hypothetical protein